MGYGRIRYRFLETIREEYETVTIAVTGVCLRLCRPHLPSTDPIRAAGTELHVIVPFLGLAERTQRLIAYFPHKIDKR